MAALAPFPTFLIIGFRRNATRWLRFNLDAHPEVCAPPTSTRFFTTHERMAALGLRWYREQFATWDGEPHLGEAAWEYLDWAHDPLGTSTRIKRLLPDVRLIAVLGDPLTRFQSALRHHIRWGNVPADIDVDDFYWMRTHGELAMKTMVEGIQWPSLDPYLERFGDQLKLVFLDDIRSDPAAVYRDVLEHLGADPSFVPPDLAQVRFSDRHVVDIAEPSLGARQYLYAWNRIDVDRLAALTGRDLSAWDPGVGPDTPTPEALFGYLSQGFIEAAEAAAAGSGTPG